MKLQDQCATLEQCKRLKELGIDVYSAFIYCRFLDDVIFETKEKKYRWDTVFTNWHPDAFSQYETCPAFTVAELLLMNDETITINKLQCLKPAEALAHHLIWRIENKEITASECNKRLTT